MFEKLIKLITHKHNYVKVSFRVEEDGDIRFSMRKYKCLDCGKEKWVDGRFDHLG